MATRKREIIGKASQAERWINDRIAGRQTTAEFTTASSSASAFGTGSSVSAFGATTGSAFISGQPATSAFGGPSGFAPATQTPAFATAGSAFQQPQSAFASNQTSAFQSQQNAQPSSAFGQSAFQSTATNAFGQKAFQSTPAQPHTSAFSSTTTTSAFGQGAFQSTPVQAPISAFSSTTAQPQIAPQSAFQNNAQQPSTFQPSPSQASAFATAPQNGASFLQNAQITTQQPPPSAFGTTTAPRPFNIQATPAIAPSQQDGSTAQIAPAWLLPKFEYGHVPEEEPPLSVR
jgi:nucleoporin NUP42